MSKRKSYGVICLLLCAAAIVSAFGLSKAGSALHTALTYEPPVTVVIDAGHGGEDGGAVSVTGVYESKLNLEIALRINDLLHLLGVQTEMVRTEDVSVYTEGSTIAQKKVSDIRHRVALVEQTPNALLVSVHQNQFSEAKYRGAQVFYAKTDGSQALAEQLQAALAVQVDPNNHRACKQAKDIYLMEHVSCPAVLVECGFLSNSAEEALLRDAAYQKKLAAAVAGTIFSYLEEADEV